MKISQITISSRGDGVQTALSATERLGYESRLGKKENLRLRLLAEEAIGMLRGIAGNIEAEYSIEEKKGVFTITLESDLMLDTETRDQLIAASTSGKNSAARGFMGKLREMVAIALVPEAGEYAMADGFSLGLMSMGCPEGYGFGAETYAWSLSRYKSLVQEDVGANQDAADAWDELEKSIVGQLADEVKVSIVRSHVKVEINKKF